jgi:hypothetical protein
MSAAKVMPRDDKPVAAYKASESKPSSIQPAIQLAKDEEEIWAGTFTPTKQASAMRGACGRRDGWTWVSSDDSVASSTASSSSSRATVGLMPRKGY